MREYKTILPFLKEKRGAYLLGILVLIIVDAVNLFIPQVIRRFADLTESGDINAQWLAKLALLILLLGAIMSIGRFIWRIEIFGSARRMEYWLRDLLFKKYLTLDDDFFNHRSTGDLMAHATNDVVQVGQSMGGGIMTVVDSLFMTTFTVIMMVSTIGLLDAAIALISLPFLAFSIAKLMVPIQRRSRALQNAFSDLTTETQENLSGMRVIKATGIEDNRNASFAGVNQDYLQKFVHWTKVDMLFDPIVTLISGLSFVIFLIYGTYRIYIGSMTIGAFVATIEYLGMIVWPLIAMGMIASRFQRGISSMSRLNEILRIRSKVQEAPNPIELEEPKGYVEFRHVSFRYRPELPWVLKDVSFRMEPGETLAILGRTGAGKSTILSLLLRRYDVTEGQILVDDVDIRDLSFESLYRTFGVVAQESFLFSRTIAGNIAFSGQEDAEKVREAASFAKVHEDIEDMKKGYETMVGERGVTLSGGQKQRVAIARAYYKKAPLLVLDDSLSAVDTETESRILQGLAEHRKGILMISQRVSTVKNAKEILVIEDGRISQRGPHEELVKQNGFYQDLYRRQLLEHQVNDSNQTKGGQE